MAIFTEKILMVIITIKLYGNYYHLKKIMKMAKRYLEDNFL